MSDAKNIISWIRKYLDARPERHTDSGSRQWQLSDKDGFLMGIPKPPHPKLGPTERNTLYFERKRDVMEARDRYIHELLDELEETLTGGDA